MFDGNCDLAKGEKEISKLLGKRISFLKIDSIEEGFSDKSYRLIVSANGAVETYFLKEVENELEYLFYKEVVCAIGIPIPYVYGVFSLDSRTYMLMEYVESTKTKWDDKRRYLESIDLLVEKDLLVRDNWKKVKQSKFIKKGVSYERIILDISRINKGKELKIHGSYNELSEFLRRNKFRMRYMQNILSNRGSLTLCHNDFHLNNVIFSKTNNKTYLIDWKNPNIGSVFIDLAQMVNVAPKKYQRDILKYYKSKIQTKEFEYIYPIAEAYDHLGVLSWVVIAIKTRKTEVPEHIDFSYKTNRFIKIVANLG